MNPQDEKLESQTVTLPWPPSANHYWRHVELPLGGKRCPVCKKGKTRVATLLSADGRQWLVDVGRLLYEAGAKPMYGALAVDVVLHPPTLAAIDIDNRLKPLLDALKRRPKDDKQPAWLFAVDDSQVKRLAVEKAVVIKGGRCIVTVTQLPEPQLVLPGMER